MLFCYSLKMVQTENFITYLAVLAIVNFIALFTRKLILQGADTVGSLLFALDRSHRHVALTNIRIAFPAFPLEKARAIAKKSFRNMCRMAIELIFMHKIIRQGKIRDILHIEGEENQKNAALKKKGIVFITAHYGVWELLFHANYLFSQDFVPIHVVIRPSDNPYLDAMINNPREMLGSHTIPKKKSIKPLLKALKAHETVAILIDQNVCREEGVFVDFFGKKAATTFGATLLALRTDAPVVPGFIHHDQKTETYTIKFLPEIPLVKTGILTEDIRINTQNFAACVESVIKEHPEDWLWIHKRWKTRPIGEEEKIY